MKEVSAQWESTLAESHEMVVKVTPLDGSQPLTPVAGSVVLDANSAIRGRVDLTFHGEDAVPLTVTDPLAPYGKEILVERGVVHPDGNTELVPLGVFGIEDASVSDSGDDLETRASGLDRARKLQAAKFEEPYEIPADTVISQAILDTCLLAWPDMPYQPGFASVTTLTLPKVIAAEGDDRWEFARGLAQSMGMVLFFDGTGLLTLRPYAAAGVVATLREGDGGLLLSASRDWTRENTFNRFIATGENTDTDDVYRGEATDDNPDSPTHYFGDFGPAPKFWSSPYIQSDAQAHDAANAMLAQEIGTSATVSFESVPNPALEPEDSVTIKRERAGISTVFVLDSVTIGLGPGDSMSGTTREVLIA